VPALIQNTFLFIFQFRQLVLHRGDFLSGQEENANKKKKKKKKRKSNIDKKISTYAINININIYICICIYMYVYVYVYMCMYICTYVNVKRVLKTQTARKHVPFPTHSTTPRSRSPAARRRPSSSPGSDTSSAPVAIGVRSIWCW
jgi:hypothetical protein